MCLQCSCPHNGSDTTLHPKKAKMEQVAGDIPLLKIPKQFDQFGKFGAVFARPCSLSLSLCVRMNKRTQKDNERTRENKLCSYNLQLLSQVRSQARTKVSNSEWFVSFCTLCRAAMRNQCRESTVGFNLLRGPCFGLDQSTSFFNQQDQPGLRKSTRFNGKSTRSTENQPGFTKINKVSRQEIINKKRKHGGQKTRGAEGSQNRHKENLEIVTETLALLKSQGNTLLSEDAPASQPGCGKAPRSPDHI